MGKVIDATGHFRMRRLEADIQRAESGQLDKAFRRVLVKDRGLCKKQGDLSGLRTLIPWGWGTSILEMYQRAENQKKLTDIMEAYVNDIILPPTLEED